MAAMYQYGYRVGLLTSGTAALIIADQVNWSFAYQSMAALMMVGFFTALLAPKIEAGVYNPPERLPPLRPSPVHAAKRCTNSTTRSSVSAITDRSPERRPSLDFTATAAAQNGRCMKPSAHMADQLRRTSHAATVSGSTDLCVA